MSKKIGALWSKQTKDGKRYLSGVLEDLSGDIRIAIFPNDRKQKDNEPDFTILRSDPMEKKTTNQAGDFLSGPVAANGEVPAGTPMNEEKSEIRPEDIPF